MELHGEGSNLEKLLQAKTGTKVEQVAGHEPPVQVSISNSDI